MFLLCGVVFMYLLAVDSVVKFGRERTAHICSPASPLSSSFRSKENQARTDTTVLRTLPTSFDNDFLRP